MRYFAFLISVLLLGACSSDCDKNLFSTSCTISHSESTSGDSATSRTSTNGSGGGTTITYSRTDVGGLPSQVYVQARYQGEPGLLHFAATTEHKGGAIFTATIAGAQFDPKFSVGGVQLQLEKAASFTIISPDTSACPITENHWGWAGETNNVVQLSLPDNDACMALLVRMKTLGYQIQFSNVPTNTGGSIASVTYVVRP